MEKPISRRIHGIADYLYAPLIFAAPEIAGFGNERQAVLACRGVGIAVLGSTMATRAEWGVVRVLPFKAHLALDVVVSLFSLAAPWFLKFAGNKRARNTFLAAGAVGAVVTSLTQVSEMEL